MFEVGKCFCTMSGTHGGLTYLELTFTKQRGTHKLLMQCNGHVLIEYIVIYLNLPLLD